MQEIVVGRRPLIAESAHPTPHQHTPPVCPRLPQSVGIAEHPWQDLAWIKRLRAISM
jgi:hypothetical protein